jgi:hypothetical protein
VLKNREKYDQKVNQGYLWSASALCIVPFLYSNTVTQMTADLEQIRNAKNSQTTIASVLFDK